MTEKEMIERRIYLKKQLIDLLKIEINGLEAELLRRDERKKLSEFCQECKDEFGHADNCVGCEHSSQGRLSNTEKKRQYQAREKQ